MVAVTGIACAKLVLLTPAMQHLRVKRREKIRGCFSIALNASSSCLHQLHAPFAGTQRNRAPAVIDSAVFEMASAVLWMEEGRLEGGG